MSDITDFIGNAGEAAKSVASVVRDLKGDKQNDPTDTDVEKKQPLPSWFLPAIVASVVVIVFAIILKNR